MDHAKLVREQVLGATKDQNLGIRVLGGENTGIEGELHVDIVNAAVIGAARRVQTLRVLCVGPDVDKVLVVALRVELLGLDLALKDPRVGLDTRRVVELDRDITDGIEELTGGLVDSTRKVKLVAVRTALGADHEDVLLNRVIELQTDIRTNCRSCLRSTRGRVVSLRRNRLDLILDLDKRLLAEKITLLIVDLDVVALDRARKVIVRQRAQGDLTGRDLLNELLIRDAIRAHTDLTAGRIDNRVVLGAKRNVKDCGVEAESREGQGEVRAPRKRKRQGHKELAAALGKLAELLVRVKLANELINLLAGLGRQDIPNLQKRVRHLINDRATNRERERLQETIANRIVPVSGILAHDGLVVLDRNNARQLDAGLCLPRNVTLTRKRELGRATKTGLRGRRIEIHGLHRKGGMALMDKTPKGSGILGVRLLMRHKLVRMALVANLCKHGIVRRATHL